MRLPVEDILMLCGARQKLPDKLEKNKIYYISRIYCCKEIAMMKPPAYCTKSIADFDTIETLGILNLSISEMELI